LSSKSDSVRGSIKKPYAKIGFQCLDLKSNGRLSQKKVLRGFVKVEALCDSAEDL
jgi:hypothetical protein